MALLTVISPASMKVRALGHSVILHFQSALWFFLYSKPSCCGHFPPMVSIPLLVTLFSFHLTSVVPLAWFSLDQSSIWPPCPILCCNSSTMPRECGKPKRGPQYYSFIARCNHPDPSHPSPPTTISPGIGQNWLDFPLPSLNAPHSPPPLSDTMLDPGSFPVDEEIPPLEMQPLEAPPEPCIITRPQARPLEQGDCMVEEEIPPSWLTDWIAQNTTPGLAMEEIPPTTFDADTTPHEDTVGKIEQPLLNPHRFFGRPPSTDL
jgi:hypothetical protein